MTFMTKADTLYRHKRSSIWY